MEKHSFQNKIGEQLKEAKTLAEEMSKILQRQNPMQKEQTGGSQQRQVYIQKKKGQESGITNYQ